MPLDLGTISLNVVYGSRSYPVCLKLPENRAGDALSLRHLTEELQRLTGVPSHRQSFIVNANMSTALRKEVVREQPDTPLHMVGIRNSVKLHMYGERREPWNDEGWIRLKGAEAEYEQLKQQMDRVFHTMNMIKQKEISVMEDDRSRQREQENLAGKLLSIRHQIHTIRKDIIGITMVCCVNEPGADRLKQRLCSNMEKRLEEIEAIIFTLKQYHVSKRAQAVF